MSDPKYWWAAIWPDGTVTRGSCRPPNALAKALDKTDRCVACSIQTEQEAVTAAIPNLKERYARWGADPIKPNSESVRSPKLIGGGKPTWQRSSESGGSKIHSGRRKKSPVRKKSTKSGRSSKRR